MAYGGGYYGGGYHSHDTIINNTYDIHNETNNDISGDPQGQDLEDYQDEPPDVGGDDDFDFGDADFGGDFDF